MRIGGAQPDDDADDGQLDIRPDCCEIRDCRQRFSDVLGDKVAVWKVVVEKASSYTGFCIGVDTHTDAGIQILRTWFASHEECEWTDHAWPSIDDTGDVFILKLVPSEGRKVQQHLQMYVAQHGVTIELTGLCGQGRHRPECLPSDGWHIVVQRNCESNSGKVLRLAICTATPAEAALVG